MKDIKFVEINDEKLELVAFRFMNGHWIGAYQSEDNKVQIFSIAEINTILGNDKKITNLLAKMNR